jgi:hypothetical protein
MTQSCRRSGFLDEAFEVRGAGRDMLREELEGDLAMKLHILGFVDDAHAAFAELLKNLIVRDC